jgi:hypothetical protein
LADERQAWFPEACAGSGRSAHRNGGHRPGSDGSERTNFIGVDLGPLSVGIGANTPDYVYVPAPAPAPTEVTPPTSYVPPPVSYQTPSTSYQAPTVYQGPTAYQAPTTSTQAPVTTTTTTTYYYYTYPSTTTTYDSYRPGYYGAPTETATTYYGQ